MFLSEGIDGIITLLSGASVILGQPSLFGANTGTPGRFLLFGSPLNPSPRRINEAKNILVFPRA